MGMYRSAVLAMKPKCLTCARNWRLRCRPSQLAPEPFASLIHPLPSSLLDESTHAFACRVRTRQVRTAPATLVQQVQVRAQVRVQVRAAPALQVRVQVRAQVQARAQVRVQVRAAPALQVGAAPAAAAAAAVVVVVVLVVVLLVVMMMVVVAMQVLVLVLVQV